MICKECYFVVEDRIIDQTSEWRNFSTEFSSHASDPNRVGGPNDELLEDSGINLKIVDKKGHCGLSKAAQKLAQEAGDKSLTKGFSIIKDFCETLHLPSKVQDKSKSIFKDIEKNRKLKGRNMESVVAAVLYVAAKCCDCQRSLKGNLVCKRTIDIAMNTNTHKKDVTRCLKLVRKYTTGANDNVEQVVVSLDTVICTRPTCATK